MVANDLNTANGISVVFQACKDLNNVIRRRDYLRAQVLYHTILTMLDVLGLEYVDYQLSLEDKELFAKWNEYRQAKDFAKADELRQELAIRGLL